MRVSRICCRMFLALMKEVRSLMLYTTTKPSAQSTGSSSIHLASEPCQEEHVLLCWYHPVCPKSTCWVDFPMEQEKRVGACILYDNIAGYHYYFYRCVPMLKTPCIFIFISLFWAKLSCFYTFLTNAHWHYCLPIDYTDLILLLFLLIKHLTVSFHTCNIETLSFYGSIAYWFTNLLSKQRVAGSVPSRDTNPFWKVSENASGVKPCQRKLTELAAVATLCDKWAAESH